MTVYKVDLRELGSIRVESDGRYFVFLDIVRLANFTPPSLMIRAEKVRALIDALENALIDLERAEDAPVVRMEE